jgi:hypothetical protein
MNDDWVVAEQSSPCAHALTQAITIMGAQHTFQTTMSALDSTPLLKHIKNLPQTLLPLPPLPQIDDGDSDEKAQKLRNCVIHHRRLMEVLLLVTQRHLKYFYDTTPRPVLQENGPERTWRYKLKECHTPITRKLQWAQYLSYLYYWDDEKQQATPFCQYPSLRWLPETEFYAPGPLIKSARAWLEEPAQRKNAWACIVRGFFNDDPDDTRIQTTQARNVMLLKYPNPPSVSAQCGAMLAQLVVCDKNDASRYTFLASLNSTETVINEPKVFFYNGPSEQVARYYRETQLYPTIASAWHIEAGLYCKVLYPALFTPMKKSFFSF